MALLVSLLSVLLLLATLYNREDNFEDEDEEHEKGEGRGRARQRGRRCDDDLNADHYDDDDEKERPRGRPKLMGRFLSPLAVIGEWRCNRKPPLLKKSRRSCHLTRLLVALWKLKTKTTRPYLPSFLR